MRQLFIIGCRKLWSYGEKLMLQVVRLDVEGVDLMIDVFLIGFSFGSFLIGRLESLNLMQVNLSDINIYFYIDIVLYIAALALSIITAVVKKENK